MGKTGIGIKLFNRNMEFLERRKNNGMIGLNVGKRNFSYALQMSMWMADI